MDTFHESYAGLDKALVKSYLAAWDAYWDDYGARVTDAVEAREWEIAARLVDDIDISEVVLDQEEFAQTMLLTGMLLGASQAAPKTWEYNILAQPPWLMLEYALDQLSVVLDRNGLEWIKKQGHLELERTREAVEAESPPEDLILKADGSRVMIDHRTRIKVQAAGRTFFALGPSMQLSRMTSLGSLLEAASRGITKYRVQAVLDERTSDICRALNGREFEVEQGLATMISLLAGDPDSAKELSPWPDAATTKLVPGMSSGDLALGGLGLPPYHPYCRTTVLVVSQTVDLDAGLATTGAHLLATLNAVHEMDTVYPMIDELSHPSSYDEAGHTSLLSFLLGALAGEEAEELVDDDLVFSP